MTVNVFIAFICFFDLNKAAEVGRLQPM